MSYNPIPPRTWSRVQTNCANFNENYEPIMEQMYKKGNILQYKKNSSNLTKTQKYSLIANGKYFTRKKQYATQSANGYTNPNTSSLKRTGYIEYNYPNNIINAPNNPSGPFASKILNPDGCNTLKIKDGGILILGTYVNPCTNEIIKNNICNSLICNPSSASNVPGNSLLCWNSKIKPWTTKKPYFPNTSSNKFPQGTAILKSAIRPFSPVIFEYNYNEIEFTITLKWTQQITCLNINSFLIFENKNLLTTLNGEQREYIINAENYYAGNYNYYIISSFNNNIFSLPSNIVTINI